MRFLHLFFSYLKYWLLQVDEHSLHSPFMYDLYIKCIKQAAKDIPDPELEALRKKMISISDSIPESGLGAKSKVGFTISKIARQGITKPKYSVLLQHLIQYFGFTQILELGTSLGINTIYLAKTLQKGRVYSFEGNEFLIGIAESNLREASIQNVNIINGNINETLLPFLQDKKELQFLFVDANHTYEATMQYFKYAKQFVSNKSLIVFDDIHWSVDMERAWGEIILDPMVTISADLFHFGLVFFRKGVSKQNYILSY